VRRAAVDRSGPVVSARSLVRVYGSGDAARAVVDGVDLEVEGGQLVAIIGHSGSGKSTLLNMIGGLDRPTSGTLRVAGHDLGACSEGQLARFRRRGVGIVFQFFQLVPELTAWENVLLPARLARDLAGGRRRAEALVEQLGVAAVVGRLPGELSGGEQQRVAIARAFVNRPKILIADEPTGNLDPNTSIGIMKLLDRINRTGTTVVMATHDAGIVDQMRKRVIELADGRVVRDQSRGVYGYQH
jgi:cell division transport system ATP-binding protein